MGRLIDADELIKALEKHYEQITMTNVPNSIPEFYCQMEKLIDTQPTAYDVEKVVAELEENYYKNGGMLIIDEVIEIVRKGGIDG